MIENGVGQLRVPVGCDEFRWVAMGCDEVRWVPPSSEVKNPLVLPLDLHLGPSKIASDQDLVRPGSFATVGVRFGFVLGSFCVRFGSVFGPF